jgi:hypothetical protein
VRRPCGRVRQRTVSRAAGVSRSCSAQIAAPSEMVAARTTARRPERRCEGADCRRVRTFITRNNGRGSPPGRQEPLIGSLELAAPSHTESYFTWRQPRVPIGALMARRSIWRPQASPGAAPHAAHRAGSSLCSRPGTPRIGDAAGVDRALARADQALRRKLLRRSAHGVAFGINCRERSARADWQAAFAYSILYSHIERCFDAR